MTPYPTTTDEAPPTTGPVVETTTEPVEPTDGSDGELAAASAVVAAATAPAWVKVTAGCTGAYTGTVTVRTLTAVLDLGAWTGTDPSSGTQLSFNELPVVGTSFDAQLVPTVDLYKTNTWYTKKTTKKWSSVKKASRAQKLTVKQGKKPGSTAPYANGECPSWAPIKGNINESRGTKIYHLPGGRWYDRTFAEICFSSVAAAKAKGFRASKNG